METITVNKKRAVTLVILVIAIISTVSAYGFGDDVDYYDSGSSYDSYDSYDSSSSYSYYDDDYYDDGYYGGSTFMSLPSAIYMVVLFVVIVYFSSNQRKIRQNAYHQPVNTGRTARQQPSAANLKRTDRTSLNAFFEQDPNTKLPEIENMVTNWIFQFENAWCEGDMSSCKAFIEDGLYNVYQNQLALIKTNGEKTVSKELNVAECQVESWFTENGKDILNVWIVQKKRTYKVSIENPNRITSGYDRTVYKLYYRWQIMRDNELKGDNWKLKKVDKLFQENF